MYETEWEWEINDAWSFMKPFGAGHMSNNLTTPDKEMFIQ